MSYKLLNYDIVEYKALEERLNELNKEGWNLKKCGLVPQFECDQKKYHYIVDVIMTENKKTKYKMLQELLDSYELIGYQYVGQLHGMVILRSERKRNRPKDREAIVSAYLKTKVIPAYVMLVASVILSIFVINYIFDHESVVSFVNNGKIILHYWPVAACLFLDIACLFKMSLRMGKFNKEEDVQKVKQSKMVLLVIVPLLVLSFLLGCVMDGFGSKTYPLDDNVITLQDLGFKEAVEPNNTYQHSSSFVLDAYTSFQSNGKEGMYQAKYCFNDDKKATKYFKQYLQSIKNEDYKIKKVDENTYLVNELGFYNAYIVKGAQSFVYISSTFDIEKRDIGNKIIEFYIDDNK